MGRIVTYSKALEQLGEGRKYLLLGNGFSIGCDPIFQYGSLYEAAVTAGLSERAQAVFARLGTNNFEGAMRLLDDAHWVAAQYKLVDPYASQLLDDVEVVKRTLVEAVANSHLEHTGMVEDGKKASALSFLKAYHSIFTTNYDLLLYWIVMHDAKGPHFEDGFRPDDDDPDAPYLVFSRRMGNTPGLYYLHGGLHLYVHEGELRKHSWIRTGQRLTELIRAGLSRSEYPLFVAEGSPERKLEQIQRSGYLWYCLDKLARVESPLVVFGHSLGASDQHISNTIARNPGVRSLYVGLHGTPKSASNEAIRQSAEQIREQRQERFSTRDLTVTYFDAESAQVWAPAEA